MIKPTEILNAADGYKHYIFYGYEKLPNGEWHQKCKDGSYGIYDLNAIDYESSKINGCWDNCYDYGKAVQSICYRNINANFVAKLLDTYFRVVSFSEENGTLYIRLKLR